MALSEEVVDEYKTSLADLNFNSKPLINMLTMLAEDHEQHAPEIVKVIEDHINKCKPERKLPALYLMDSIMKNLEKSSYRSLFSRNVVQTFTSVFEQVDEKTRASMFKLRQTWSNILPNATMYRIDKKINSLLDPAWPVTATEPEQTSIHVNPRFLQGMGSESERSSPEVTEEPAVEDSEDQEMLIRQQLIEKQQELLRLKQARLELELAETAEKLKRKPGAKGHSSVKSVATPLGLPMPSVEDTLPLPEIAAKPRDPRPRPTDPRRRDPRLQSQVVSSPSSVQGSESVVTSLHGHGALPNTSSVPVVPGSSHSTFPPVSPHGPYSVGQMPPAGLVPFSDPGQALASIPPYNGLQGPGMPYPPVVGMPPNIPGQVFSGEVFIPDDCAKFSDENDSDSSRSSIQGQNNSSLSQTTYIRDPRHRIENKRNNKDPRVEYRSDHHDRRKNVDKSVNRHSHEKHGFSAKDSHRDTKDPRLSGGRETQEKRKSKDREMHVSSKQTKESVPDSPRKSASGQQVSKYRSVSKDRESKSETKLKDLPEAKRNWKEEEIKRPETRSSRKSEEKPKERTSRERERSPQQSIKQYSNKSRDFRGAGDRKAERRNDEKKDTRSEPKKTDTTANKRGNKTTDRKADKSRVSRAKEGTSKVNVEPMDIDDRVRPAREAEKRLSSDREINERTAKKPKLEKSLPETVGTLEEKTSELDGKTSIVAPVEEDVNIKEEDMDIVSDQEQVPEPDVPKIDEDFSDLFGAEDEDYRPTVQKQQLPLKSPSSKGWDQYKASQPDQYAYDIELKKQRQDSVVENAERLEDEPQDEDLRVHQPEFQRQRSGAGVDEVSIPDELDMSQHHEILLKAHKQFKEGLISHEQHQELLKQLGELMHLQQLQEENRRHSGEMLQSQEIPEENRRLSRERIPSQVLQEEKLPVSSEMLQSQEQVSSSNLQTSHEWQQELLKQKRELMHLQELEEANRRLSSEMLQLQEIPEENFRLSRERIPSQVLQEEKLPVSSEMLQSQEQVSSSNLQTGSTPPRQPEQVMPETIPLREVRSPERPLDNFKIPKRTTREKTDEDDRRKELCSLYPESPQEDRYRAHGPFSGRDNQNRRGPEVSRRGTDERGRSLEDQPWKEGWRAPRDDFNERGPSAYRQGQEISASPRDRFDAPPEHEDSTSGDFRRSPPRENEMENYTDRRMERLDGPPENFDGRMHRTDGPPDNFEGRMHRPDGPPDDFDGRMRRPDGPVNNFDGRRPRPDGPHDEFDDQKPRLDGPTDGFDGRRPRQDGPPGGFVGRRPRQDGPPDGFDGRRPRQDGPPDGFDGRRPRQDGPPDGFDGRNPRLDGPPDDFDGRMRRSDGPPDSFDGRRPRQDGPPDGFDGRKPRPDGPSEDLDGRWPRESDYEQRGPPDRFEHELESRGPYRDRKPNNWQERGGPDVQSNQRGQWGHDIDRRGREEDDTRDMDEGPEFFSGPPGRFPDEDSRRPGKPNWRDSRRSDKWRDQDDANFEKRGPRDRYSNSRGPPGRFREGRNIDHRGSNEPEDFPPDGRGGPRDHPGRDRTGRSHDRRSGPSDDRRPWKDEDGPPNNRDNGPKSQDDSRKPKLKGPYGRPGPPSEGSKPWLPPGQRDDSPKKEPWRGHPDKKSDEKPRSHRHGRKGDRHDEAEYEPAFIEKPKPKPLMSLLDPLPPRPPPGLRGNLGDPRMQGPGPRGPQRFDGPGPNGPSSMNRPEGPLQPQVDTYVDKFGDPRFRCFVDMGPEVSEEVVIGKRNFEIKLGAPPRKIAWGKDFIEVFADPSKRGIVIDQNLMYKFGERVKDVTIRGRKEKLFYHGCPLNLWIDGQHYEVRMDAPPKSINIDGKVHKIQIDGRDMMILIDKEEKGRFGGPPRFMFIDEERKEIRFEPPPRHILIDGSPSELKLNMQQPCINIKGIHHGIRFDGPPRDVFIDGKLYQIFTDHAVKIRVGNRFHYVALGGPCHEIIVDGKWFEMKFNEAPKEVNVGNHILMVRLPGSPPEVKILPEIAQETRPVPPGMPGPMRPPGIMPGPGPMGFVGPRGPNMGPGMPMPGVGPPGIPPMQQPAGPMQPLPGPMPGPQMNIPLSSAPSMPLSGPPMIPGIGMPMPGAPVSQPSGMPNVLSSLFPVVPATSSTSAPIDIKSLFDKLVNTGIIKKEEPDVKPDIKPASTKAEVAIPQEYAMPQKKTQKQEKFADIPDMREMNPNEMKSLPVGMVQRLYSGIQCTSCGERFMLKDGEKTEKYRQHLDWHFRQNKKGKTDMKVTSCRKWYYTVNEWMQFEEVTDTKETGRSNFFEQQQQQPVDTTPTKNPLTLVVPEGVSAIKCPAATGNDNEDICNICHEVFEQYWDEELEEWHLREAIKVNNKTYHPICFEDHTDVSEGTPSPSVLSVTEPGFVSRKSLAYDEASQDGHHASFEEERKISTSVTEPMDTTAASDSPSLNAPIKTEPSDDSEHVKTVEIKQEPVMEAVDIKQETVMEAVDIKQEMVTEAVDIKQETVTEVMSHDETDSVMDYEAESHTVVVKQEPSDVLENLPESNMETPLQPSVEIKTEPVDRTVEQENDSGPDEDLEKDIETPMECSDSAVPETSVTTKSVSESDTESAIAEAQEPVTDTQSDPEEEEKDKVAESEPEIESDSQPKTNTEISTSGIHVSVDSTHLAPPDDQEVCETQHSPTYSKLSKISLVIPPPQTADISPEVLEIGSNASTPTQDELPSPPGEES